MPVLIVVGIVITQTTSHPTSPTAAAADDEALSGRQVMFLFSLLFKQ